MIVTNNNVDLLTKVLSKYDDYAIIPHYNPDPDALGSAFGMHFILKKHFHKQSTIFFHGIIGRAENKSMVDILDIPIQPLKDEHNLPDQPIILMDTQPGTGNNPLARGMKPLLIFDHHPIRTVSKSSEFADIRLDYGSTSTIVFDYMKLLEIKPVVNVATALYYGIQTDVVGEGRSGNKVDFTALEILSKYINRSKLYSIENPKLPFEYYMNINKGLKNSVIYDNFVISSLGDIDNPDYVSEIADFLIRFDRAFVVLVMGIYKNSIQLSFRVQNKKQDAGLILKKIVGNLGTAGGHAKNSGGRILFDDNDDVNRISKKIITRSIEIIHGKIMTGIPLLSLGDYLKL